MEHETDWEKRQKEYEAFRKACDNSQPYNQNTQVFPEELLRQMGKIVKPRNEEYFGTLDHYKPTARFEEIVFQQVSELTGWNLNHCNFRTYLSQPNDFTPLSSVLTNLFTSEASTCQ